MSENVFNDSDFDNGAPEVGSEVELASGPQEDVTKATPKNSRRATSKAPSAPKRGRVSAPAAEKALESEAQPPPPPAQPYYAQPAPQQPQYPMMPQYGMQYNGQQQQPQQPQYVSQYPAPQPGYVTQQPKRNAFAEGIYAQLPVEAKQAAAERDYARGEGGRIDTATSQAAANGARIGDHFERSYKEENWAFTMQKWLSFHLCEPCTRLFLCDNGRVQHLGGGYRLLSFVACPACMRNNNEIKRMYKEYFPTSYRSQQ